MRLSRFTVLIAAALSLSCSDSSAPEPSFAGIYALSTVNAHPLPIDFIFGATDFRWPSGSVQVLPSQHFSRIVVQEDWEGGILARTDTVHFSDARAFYRKHGTIIQFYYVIGSLDGLSVDTVTAFSGTLSADGSALTIITDDGLAGNSTRFEYER